ncbi:MAG: DUF2000 domain-containing protein [Clostridia bacterium]|nr:DUF2000 domain-containing protein [Clostridia bacterium]
MRTVDWGRFLIGNKIEKNKEGKNKNNLDRLGTVPNRKPIRKNTSLRKNSNLPLKFRNNTRYERKIKMVYNDKYKFVAVINEKIETGKALNAIAHMGLGLVNIADEQTREKMSFIDFKDKNENSHKSISGLSLIVLRRKE